MGSRLATQIIPKLSELSKEQLKLVAAVIESITRPVQVTRNPASDIITQQALIEFGEILKLHHCLSSQYLDKDRFETAMERIYRDIGIPVQRPGNRCNPGHDITVAGARWSLKTQGDREIKPDLLHISKFMELGKGKWKNEADLVDLRSQFLKHMRNYERIFQLRYFKKPMTHFYELVEIPKPLLEEAKRGKLEMARASKQDPKPGYCRVFGIPQRLKFELYFDGGSERKLQIKKLRKDLCIVHATWELPAQRL